MGRKVGNGDELRTGAIDGEVAKLFLGGDEPGNEGADEAEDGREGGRGCILLFPHQGQGGWENGGGDDDAHHEVQVAHGDARVYVE